MIHRLVVTSTEPDDGFESHRAHLIAVAYRMLGSVSAAEDAVQETWVRFANADITTVEDPRAWLTTVTSRVCLNVLRSRRTRRAFVAGETLVDPTVRRHPGDDPERETILADTVGTALLVVLEALTPAERVAFVLHDVFAVPFDEIAALLDRTPTATRQLASRARRRVRRDPDSASTSKRSDRDLVNAFFAAARSGDLDQLVALLDTDVLLRADTGPTGSVLVRGAPQVARRALMFAIPDAELIEALVDGHAGIVVSVEGRVHAIMRFVVGRERIVEIAALTDRASLSTVDLRDVLR